MPTAFNFAASPFDCLSNDEHQIDGDEHVGTYGLDDNFDGRALVTLPVDALVRMIRNKVRRVVAARPGETGESPCSERSTRRNSMPCCSSAPGSSLRPPTWSTTAACS